LVKNDQFLSFKVIVKDGKLVAY